MTCKILGQLFRTGKINCIYADFNDIKFIAKCYHITAIFKRIINTQFQKFSCHSWVFENIVLFWFLIVAAARRRLSVPTGP